MPGLILADDMIVNWVNKHYTDDQQHTGTTEVVAKGRGDFVGYSVCILHPDSSHHFGSSKTGIAEGALGSTISPWCLNASFYKLSSCLKPL